jgi:hypothetical protein
MDTSTPTIFSDKSIRPSTFSKDSPRAGLKDCFYSTTRPAIKSVRLTLYQPEKWLKVCLVSRHHHHHHHHRHHHRATMTVMGVPFLRRHRIRRASCQRIRAGLLDARAPLLAAHLALVALVARAMVPMTMCSCAAADFSGIRGLTDFFCRTEEWVDTPP